MTTNSGVWNTTFKYMDGYHYRTYGIKMVIKNANLLIHIF